MRPNISLAKQTRVIKAKMQNMAELVAKGSQKELENQAEKVMQAAIEFAPRKSGALENPKNWEVVKKRDGINGRNTFTVRLREKAVARKSGKNNSKIVRLRDYARIVHDSTYKLGEKSKEKARGLGLSFSPISGGQYVGRLYLTRAINKRRLPTHNAVLNATKKALKQ